MPKEASILAGDKREANEPFDEPFTFPSLLTNREDSSATVGNREKGAKLSKELRDDVVDRGTASRYLSLT